MNNLNLKSKLILLLLLPIIGLLFLSFTLSYDRYETYAKQEMLNKIVLLSTKTKTLINSLQKERGFSNGYLGSKGTSFKHSILNQQINTNKQKEELTNYLKTINLTYYGEDFKNLLDKALNKLNKIGNIREKTFELKAVESEINTYYTTLIDTFIQTITYTSNFSTSETLSRQLNAYSSLTYAIEKIANERGFGTLAYSSKELSYSMRNNLYDLVLQQSIYLNIFKQNIDKKLLEKYETIFKGKTIDESIRMRSVLLDSIEKKLILLKINALKNIKAQNNELINLLNEYKNIKHLTDKEKEFLKQIDLELQNEKALKKSLNIFFNANFLLDDSNYWFNTMTTKISLLEQISTQLVEQMLGETQKISSNAKNDVIFYSVLCVLILIAVLFIGRNISINIVNSVNALLEGINRFFKFVNKKTDNIQLIKIQSNDEIGAISKIINEKIAISKKIIDEDIIERAKQLEEEVKRKTKDLKTKNIEYEILLDRFNKHAIATRTDTLGMITFATDKFCELSGYTKEELIGENHNIVRHPDMLSEIYEEMWDTIQAGEKYVGELKNKRKDGSHYWIKLIIVPEFDENNNIIGYFSVKENIDDKIKIREFNNVLEEKVKKAVEESRKKDELLSYQSKLATMGEMIGIIAHQWKQPLSSLAMRIQTIKYKKSISDEYKEEYVAENMNLIQFMSKTIDDFRDFFRQDKIKEDFNIVNCINKTLNIVKPQLDEVRVNIKVHGEEFITNGLQSEFQQVIVNLITNAKDELVKKDLESKNIEIETKIENNKGILLIKDNAGGIPPEIIDNIFEPYFTTKETGKGTGIGLYISKTIIEDTMKGKLSVTNENGGACFRIVLPCQV